MNDLSLEYTQEYCYSISIFDMQLGLHNPNNLNNIDYKLNPNLDFDN